MRRILSVPAAAPPITVDLFLNPFNKDSAHHRPIGTGATYASTSDPATSQFIANNWTYLNVGMPYGVYAVKNTSSQTARTVNMRDVSGSVVLKMPSIVDGGSSTTDDLVTIYNDAGGTSATQGLVYEFYRWDWGGGSPSASFYRTYSLTGKGHKDSGSFAYEGMTAGGPCVLFGASRSHELNNSSTEIYHVMHLAVTSPVLANSWIWPCTAKDGFCDGVNNCTGNVQYGSLWALPQSTYTDSYIENSMGLSALGKRLARQLRNYGAYIVDQGPFIGRVDQEIISSVASEVNTQMRIIWKLLRRVTNSVQGQTASGGGSPIAPNTAFDA